MKHVLLLSIHSWIQQLLENTRTHVRLTKLFSQVFRSFHPSLSSFHPSIYPSTLSSGKHLLSPIFQALCQVQGLRQSETDRAYRYMKLQVSTWSERFYMISVAVSVKTTIFKKFSWKTSKMSSTSQINYITCFSLFG